MGNRGRRPWLLLALISVSFATQGTARAEAADEAPQGYQQAIAQALSELEASNFPEALEEFRRAHALFPNARTLRGLGMVEFELRNYAECVQLLQESLASAVKPLDAKLRADTETLLARARRYLGEVRVETDPSSATLIVDGSIVPVGKHGAILLEVGEHTLEVQSPGHAPATRVVQVRGGTRHELHISLSARGPRAVDARGSTASTGTSEVQPTYKKWWLWTAVAVVAVGGATAAALLISRDHDKGTSEVAGGNYVGVSLLGARRF
jgi:hypothetical protein